VATEDDLERVGRAYRRAKERSDALHAELKAVVITAYKAGVGTMEIAARTRQARELIRRIRIAAEKTGELVPSGDD